MFRAINFLSALAFWTKFTITDKTCFTITVIASFSIRTHGIHITVIIFGTFINIRAIIGQIFCVASFTFAKRSRTDALLIFWATWIRALTRSTIFSSTKVAFQAGTLEAFHCGFAFCMLITVMLTGTTFVRTSTTIASLSIFTLESREAREVPSRTLVHIKAIIRSTSQFSQSEPFRAKAVVISVSIITLQVSRASVCSTRTFV